MCLACDLIKRRRRTLTRRGLLAGAATFTLTAATMRRPMAAARPPTAQPPQLISGAEVWDGVADQPLGPRDIIAMPGNPFADITVTEKVDFVMRGGLVHKTPAPA